jgi:hypothetical protein
MVRGISFVALTSATDVEVEQANMSGLSRQSFFAFTSVQKKQFHASK